MSRTRAALIAATVVGTLLHLPDVLAGMKRLGRLAEAQHGVFARWQAKRLGFDRFDLRRLLRAGAIEQVTEQVFRMVGSRRTWRQRLMVAVLDAGPDAVAAGLAAACMHDLPGFARVIAVAGPRNGRRRSTTGALHRPRHMPSHHRCVRDGIPVTTIERTLFDVAGFIHPKRLERAIDTALNKGWTTIDKLWSTWADLATSDRRCVRVMKAALSRLSDDYVPPESELEARFIELLEQAGLPLPRRQVNLGTAEEWVGRVDFTYAPMPVVIEVNGNQHRSELQQRADEARRLELEAAGVRVLTFWWQGVVENPAKVIAAVRSALEQAAAAA